MADRRGRPPLFILVPPEQDEHELQESVTGMLHIILLPDVQWTSVDHSHSINMQLGRNGRPIGLIEAGKRKRRGIKPGIWDILLWRLGQGYAIELKVGNNDLSDDQETFGEGLIRAGVKLKVCWNKDQVFDTVVGWGLTRPMRVAA